LRCQRMRAGRAKVESDQPVQRGTEAPPQSRDLDSARAAERLRARADGFRKEETSGAPATP
jgi:hypothetical protein